MLQPAREQRPSLPLWLGKRELPSRQVEQLWQEAEGAVFLKNLRETALSGLMNMCFCLGQGVGMGIVVPIPNSVSAMGNRLEGGRPLLKALILTIHQEPLKVEPRILRVSMHLHSQGPLPGD